MAGFKFSATGGEGFFRIGRKPSIYSNGVEFTIKTFHTGMWYNNEKSSTDPVNRKTSTGEATNSIRFETNLSSDEDDWLNINLFLGRRKVVYDKDGHAFPLWSCEFHQELVNFLENEIGRHETDTDCLKLSAKDVAEKVINEFFNGKTITVEEVKDVYFKNIRDGVEKLELPITPLVVFKFKE